MRNLRMNAAATQSMLGGLATSVIVGSLSVAVATAMSPSGAASVITTAPSVAPSPGDASAPRSLLRADRRRRPRHLARAVRPAAPVPAPRPALAPSAGAPRDAGAATTPATGATASSTRKPTPTPTVTPTATATVTATPSPSPSPRGVVRFPPRPGFQPWLVPPCRPDVFYTIDFHRPVDFFIPHAEYIDGPGGDMQVWVKRVHLVRLHVFLEKEVETDFNIQNFIARVRKNFFPGIEEEHAVEIGHQYTVHISKGMYGHIRYRVFGVRVGFHVWRVFPNCGRLLVNTGTATFPTIREGWKYWETKRLRPYRTRGRAGGHGVGGGRRHEGAISAGGVSRRLRQGTLTARQSARRQTAPAGSRNIAKIPGRGST